MLTRCFVSLIISCLLAAVPAFAYANTMLILGDSLSAAHGIPRESSWTSLLDQRLQKTHPTTLLINASIGGETTGGGVARLPALLEQHKPDIVIIELGGNDGLRGFPIAVMRSNLETLISTSQTAGAKVLLIGMRIPPNYGPRYTKQFYATFDELAHQHDTALVPFMLEGIATEQALMQGDGIHPNAAAQALILENVWPPLESLLKTAP